MKNYISVNVVSQALIFLSSVVEHGCDSLQEASQLKMPYGINFDTAFSFAQQCQWITLSNGAISITQNGKKIDSQFDGLSISKGLWRDVLSIYIDTCHPAWSKRIPYGRKEAYLFMNPEEQECFCEADLMDSIEKDVIAWWDRLSQQQRQFDDEAKNEIGRQGELLTIEYEATRTGVQPEWRSIETNVVGYDILSQKSSSDTTRILIEVKTSVLGIPDASFVLTRNEWNTATRANNSYRYYFYLWCIHGNTSQLAVISVDQLRSHIPDDNSAGIWETVRIPFVAFGNLFR